MIVTDTVFKHFFFTDFASKKPCYVQFSWNVQEVATIGNNKTFRGYAGLLRFAKQNAFYSVHVSDNHLLDTMYCLKLHIETWIRNSKEDTNFGAYLVTLFKRPEHRTEIAKIDICSILLVSSVLLISSGKGWI